MKIFSVYLRVDTTVKPEWFDDVRSKFSSNNILHITLLQPRYVKEDEIASLKRQIESVIKNYTFTNADKELNFSSHRIEIDLNDKYIFMAYIERNMKIESLQKALVYELSKYNQYCDMNTIDYEQNFNPHLTIADQIELDKDSRKIFAQEPFILKGVIQDLVLAVVNDQTVSEIENPDNWIVMDLK